MSKKQNPSASVAGKLASLRLEKVCPIVVEGREIIPVETSTFQTIDFSKNPKAILYSDRLTACPIVLIKNLNRETGKYDNVVTMMHFFPNNAWKIDVALHNFSLALADFESKGGLVSADTSIQLIGGCVIEGEDEKSSARNVLSSAFKSQGFDKKVKYREVGAGVNKIGDVTKQSSEVFVSAESTQIFQRTRDAKTNKIAKEEWLTQAHDSIPQEFLATIHDQLPQEFLAYIDRRYQAISRSDLSKPALMVNMDRVRQDIANAQFSAERQKEK